MPRATKTKSIEPEFTVRSMKVEDVPKIYALGEKLFSPEVSVTLYRTWDQYEIAQLFFADHDYCFVLECEGRVAGFILGTVIEKPRTGRQYGYILWLGAAKAYQGSGAADLLVRKLVRRFRKDGVQMVIADTSAVNTRAIKFFNRHGFSGMQEHVYLSKNLTNIQKNKHK